MKANSNAKLPIMPTATPHQKSEDFNRFISLYKRHGATSPELLHLAKSSPIVEPCNGKRAAFVPVALELNGDVHWLGWQADEPLHDPDASVVPDLLKPCSRFKRRDCERVAGHPATLAWVFERYKLDSDDHVIVTGLKPPDGAMNWQPASG